MTGPKAMTLDGGAPGYWMNETSGVLRPAIVAYLAGTAMTSWQIAIMRSYLRQWIGAPAWLGPDVAELRATVDGLTTRHDISAWLDLADRAGVDPL